MIRITLFLLIILSALNSQGQEILYIFPDSVERSIDTYIKRGLSNDKNKQFFITLYEDKGIYTVYIDSFTKSSDQRYLDWVKASTRKVLIDKVKLPILLEIDYTFGAPDKSKIGNYGNRDGQVKRSAVINEGFNIKFDKKGTIY